MGELIFVGLGLCGRDLTIKATETLRNCERVFAEFYTSAMFDTSLADLERMIGREIEVLGRREVEESDRLIEAARGSTVAFLTAGDPMAATTHLELRIRARKEGIDTGIVHGISIFSACASALGLQPYKFGRTVTLPLPEEGYFPQSPYDNILENFQRGLHTLILLDIREEEGRYMSAREGIRWLLEAEGRWMGGLVTEDTLICVGARIGSSTQKLEAGRPRELLESDFGPPLHTLVLPGKLHFMESEALITLVGAPPDLIRS